METISRHWVRFFPTESGSHVEGHDHEGKLQYGSHIGLKELARNSSASPEIQKELNRRNKRNK